MRLGRRRDKVDVIIERGKEGGGEREMKRGRRR